MIVNSHPYNPASQQQLCQPIDLQSSDPLDDRLGAMADHHHQQQQQQHQNNSLYGSSLANAAGSGPTNQHMLDMANLQQGFEVASSARGHHHQRQVGGGSQQQQPQDLLYSPSSSTSLLYHIYDQINLPSEQSAVQSQQQQQPAKKGPSTSTTTILNPANLFGGASPGGPTQACYPNPYQTTLLGPNYRGQQQQQQQLAGGYPTSYHAHSQQASFSGDHLQLDQALIRHQQQQLARALHASTLRPLSSSTTTSSSATSGHNNNNNISYSRQPRHLVGGAGKSHSNLANILHQGITTGSSSSNTLSTHLGALDGAKSISSSGGPMNSVLADLYAVNQPASHRHIATLNTNSNNLRPHLHHDHHQHHHHQVGGHHRRLAKALFGAAKVRRASQRAKSTLHQHQGPLIVVSLVLLLTLCLLSMVRWSGVGPAGSGGPFAGSPTSLQVMPQAPQLSSSSSSSIAQQSNILQQQQQPTFLYPPFSKAELAQATLRPAEEQPTVEDTPPAAPNNNNNQDGLKSRLIFGDFVILSQNYTGSSQKALIGERIVKLMDQVFLSTDVRRFYSRMEVTNIRPFRPNAGVVVDCVIVLSQSTAYAAQQFGIALYESLSRSNERLAGQPNYVIDKNSIRFNTLPDRDLRAGSVPASLVSTGLLQELLASPAESPLAAPPSVTAQHHHHQPTAARPSNHNDAQPLRQVVWSEWSQWSSCLDKNGGCDPMRIHSRIRNCVVQNTGEKADEEECKTRFDPQDRAFEIADCSSTCSGGGGPAPTGMGEGGPLSDAPSVLPSGAAGLAGAHPTAGTPVQAKLDSLVPLAAGLSQPAKVSLLATPTPATPATASGLSAAVEGVAGEPAPSSSSSGPRLEPLATPTPFEPPTGLETGGLGGVSCSNCTSDEICLLLVSQKVPFCAKVRDRQDDSGCGGWCRAQSQLCQPVGANAFKCIHDSECLAEEWRCHDSGCIPLIKRCDGHSNCYDSSDERDCPAPATS